MARGGATEQAARTSFRDVFAVAEFRALWMAQLLSVVGDQLARVALTVLVYDRTRSALLAAITFVVSIVPTFIGGVTLAWLADRYPRRAVMIACDIARGVLVLVMAIPACAAGRNGGAALRGDARRARRSLSARAAIYPDVLTGDRYVMGTAVTLTTYQFAQVIGFAAGGALVGFFGTRTSLVVDAATFAVSALIVRAWVRPRPAPAAAERSPRVVTAGRPLRWRPARLRHARHCARRCCSAGWPRSTTLRRAWRPRSLRALGGGAAIVGVILAAQGPGADRRRDHVQPFRRSRDTAALHGSAGRRHLRGSRPVLLAARPGSSRC